MGAYDRAGELVASHTAYHPSLARQALCRQTPNVGARCGNTARWDLCGGHMVTCVPTAILDREAMGKAAWPGTVADMCKQKKVPHAAIE